MVHAGLPLSTNRLIIQVLLFVNTTVTLQLSLSPSSSKSIQLSHQLLYRLLSKCATLAPLGIGAEYTLISYGQQVALLANTVRLHYSNFILSAYLTLFPLPICSTLVHLTLAIHPAHHVRRLIHNPIRIPNC